MSDVFDEYAKIMEAKGFFKKAQQTRIEKEDDSDYAEKIKALYGIDIKLNDSNKDIIEQAHPERVIVAPSYDRVNGLVENIRERHDIMVGICNKPTNGNLTQHRYAEQDLMDELVRIGFSFDNEGNEQISKLADQCAVDLNVDINKKIASLDPQHRIEKRAWILQTLRAVGPWVARGLMAVTTIATIKTHIIGNISQGIIPDAEVAIDALGNLNSNVSDRYSGTINQWIRIIQFIKQNAGKAEDIAGNIDMQTINSPEDINGSLDAKRRISASQEDLKYLQEFKKMAEYVANKIGSGGVISGSGFLGEIEAMQSDNDEADSQLWTGIQSLWSSSFGDHKTAAKNALAALRNSLIKFVDDFNSATSEATSQAKQNVSILEQVQQMYGGLETGSKETGLGQYVSES
jgi:hypothetical protein